MRHYQTKQLLNHFQYSMVTPKSNTTSNSYYNDGFWLNFSKPWNRIFFPDFSYFWAELCHHTTLFCKELTKTSSCIRIETITGDPFIHRSAWTQNHAPLVGCRKHLVPVLCSWQSKSACAATAFKRFSNAVVLDNHWKKGYQQDTRFEKTLLRFGDSSDFQSNCGYPSLAKRDE